MNHNESNIVSLKLSEYVAKSDAEKVDRKGWRSEERRVGKD